MIWSFLTSFPLLCLVVAGLIHIVELGRLAVLTEQSSFFAARSEYVDRDRDVDLAEKSIQHLSEHILGNHDVSEQAWLQLERKEVSREVGVMDVNLDPPNTRLLDDLLNIARLRREDSFLPRPRLTGSTPIPKYLPAPERATE